MGELITGQAATYVEEMHINTTKRYEICCITRDVERIVAQSGIKDGLVLVNPMHITASCYVNDLEYGLHHDIMAWLYWIHAVRVKVPCCVGHKAFMCRGGVLWLWRITAD